MVHALQHVFNTENRTEPNQMPRFLSGWTIRVSTKK